jgi:two-component system phosphate regulon sensor histidine kinase PhoR
MTIASLGLMGFQYYWVRNALKINEERFEQNVFQSLSLTINALENSETSDIFLTYLSRDTLLQQYLFKKIEPIEIMVREKPKFNKRPSISDSVMRLNMPQISPRFQRIMESKGVDLKLSADLDNFFTNLTPEMAASLFTPDEMEILLQERERQLQYLNQTDNGYYGRSTFFRENDIDKEYNIPQDALYKIRNTNMKIEAMNRAWQELLEGQKEVLSRLDSVNVKFMVSKFLNERGINQPFELILKDDRGNITPFTPIQDLEIVITEGIQARLFPADILGKENFLLMHFPNKRNYILKQIWLKNQFALLVEKRQGIIEFTSEINNPYIEVDPFHIAHIFNNLLDNAVKYAKGIPKITIRVKEDQKFVIISIEDNGIGLSKDSLKKIFDKFYRVPTGNVHDIKGFGLGLAYVKTMIEAHHGTIAVISELGKGSTFTIRLPKKDKI